MKRKTNTVNDLAKWIAAEIQPDEEGSRCLTIDREWVLDPSRELRQRTADELVTLHDRLRRAIPDDFDFSMEFEDGEVFATLEYADGPHAGYGSDFPVALDRNLVSALCEYDWDSLRAMVIQGTQFHENTADMAGDFPCTLETTGNIQERHAATIEQFQKDPEFADSTYTMLSANEWEDEEESEDELDEPSLVEYEVFTFPNLDNLLGQMGDLLTFRHTIVAILRSGKILSPEETDGLRQEALEGLGPISRAKAEGRFGAAAAMMQNPF